MKRIVEQLIGRKITKVTAGGSNGSIIILEIDSRFVLFVYCAWRLELGERILTGWNDCNDPISGVLTQEIKKLNDNSIRDVSLSAFFDLKINFSDNKTLNVFVDITSHMSQEASDENWSVCDTKNDRCLTVNKDQMVIEQSYR